MSCSVKQFRSKKYPGACRTIDRDPLPEIQMLLLHMPPMGLLRLFIGDFVASPDEGRRAIFERHLVQAQDRNYGIYGGKFFERRISMKGAVADPITNKRRFRTAGHHRQAEFGALKER